MGHSFDWNVSLLQEIETTNSKLQMVMYVIHVYGRIKYRTEPSGFHSTGFLQDITVTVEHYDEYQ